MIDFVEHQFDMMNLVKTQCSLMQITTSSSGELKVLILPSKLKGKLDQKKLEKTVILRWCLEIG
jgi:hypothetical protein